MPAEAAAPAVSRETASLFREPLLGRIIIGSITRIIINAVVNGFVTWLPTFFIRQGMTLQSAFNFSLRSARTASRIGETVVPGGILRLPQTCAYRLLKSSGGETEGYRTQC